MRRSVPVTELTHIFPKPSNVRRRQKRQTSPGSVDRFK